MKLSNCTSCEYQKLYGYDYFGDLTYATDVKYALNTLRVCVVRCQSSCINMSFPRGRSRRLIIIAVDFVSIVFDCLSKLCHEIV